jgi:hypothetical protein
MVFFRDGLTSSQISDARNAEVLVKVLDLAWKSVLCDARQMVGKIEGWSQLLAHCRFSLCCHDDGDSTSTQSSTLLQRWEKDGKEGAKSQAH